MTLKETTPIGNYDLCVVSVSIDSPLNLKGDPPFYSTAYEYSCAYWDGLCEHVRDVLWEDILKLYLCLTFVFAVEFCEWFQVEISVYIPHGKYQLKPLSFPRFSSASAAFIAHRNHFFCFYQQNESPTSKVNSRQAIVIAKGSWSCQTYLC